MPESKRTYQSTSPGGLGLRLEKTSSSRPSAKKRPVPLPKEEDTPERVDLINRLIERIKTV